MPADELLNEFVPRLENTHYFGNSFPRFWPNFGPGIVAAFAGAQVHPAWDTTWFTPGKPSPIADLRVASDWQSPWWRRVYEITQAAVNRWPPDRLFADLVREEQVKLVLLSFSGEHLLPDHGIPEL